MKLYSRKFVRRQRRLVRREVKANPEWRKTARRLFFRRARRPLGPAALRWLAPWVLVLMTVSTSSEAPTFWLTLLLWTVMMVFLRGYQLQELTFGRARPLAFVQLPVTSLQVWRYIAGRVVRTSAWVLYDAVIFVWFACFSAHVPPGVWLGLVPVVMLIWMSVVATCVVLSWKFPRFPHGLLAFGVFGAGFFGAILFSKNQLTTEQLNEIHRFLLWATPQGWACQVAEWLVNVRPDFPALALGLLAVLCASAVPCYRALADRYVFWELDLPTKALPPQEESDAIDAEEVSEQKKEAERENLEAIEACVRKGEYLPPPTRHAGDWLDRAILSQSGRREAVTDFMLGRVCGWGALYGKGALLILVAPLLAGLSRFLGASLSIWVLGLALVAGLGMTTPLFGGEWLGFALGALRPRSIAVLALLPVGLREIRGAILRTNALRFAAAWPCWIIAGGWGLRFLNVTPLDGVRVAVGVWLALLLLQPFFLVFAYSKGTNDTSSGCLNMLLFIFLVMWPVCAATWVGIALLMPLAWPWQVASLAALGLASYGFEAGYRRVYCAQRFDLLTKAPEETV